MLLHSALFRRLIGATLPARRRDHAICYLSNTTSASSRRRTEAALRAVEQLRVLQQTQRPVSGRDWRAAVECLQHEVTALHVPTHFSQLHRAAVILSDKRPLNYERVLLKIMLHHVLQQSPDVPAAAHNLFFSHKISSPAASSCIDVSPDQERGDVGKDPPAAAAPARAAQTTAPVPLLTDEQHMQLLLCWDKAAALRPSLEILTQPLLQSLLRRISSRIRQSHRESIQGPTGVITTPQVTLVAPSLYSHSTNLRWSADSNGVDSFCYSSNSHASTSLVSSLQTGVNQDRRTLVVKVDKAPPQLGDGGRIVVSSSCEGEKPTRHVSNKQAAVTVSGIHMAENVRLLSFFGRHLEELLRLEEEHVAAARVECRAAARLQQQNASTPRTQVNEGASSQLANKLAVPPSGANFNTLSGISNDRFQSDSISLSGSCDYFRLQKQLELSVQEEPQRLKFARREGEEGLEAPTAADHSTVACIAWSLCLHCYDAWRSTSKLYAWKDHQGAAVFPELALSGARVLLALLQHLHTVEAEGERTGCRMKERLTRHSTSEAPQQQPEFGDRMDGEVLHIRACHLQQQPSSCLKHPRTKGEKPPGIGNANAGEYMPSALGCRRGWDSGCRTAVDVDSRKNQPKFPVFQTHDLQRQAAMFQRLLLQLPMQSLSHAQALIQVPAAAYFLHVLHDAASNVRAQHGCKQDAEQGNSRPPPPEDELGGAMEAEQAGWRSLCLSLDRHIRQERARRNAGVALQVQDVCDCFNAALIFRWFPMGTLRRLLQTACSRTDNLSHEQRADLETALFQLSAVLEELSSFIRKSVRVYCDSIVVLSKNFRHVLHGSELPSSGGGSICCLTNFTSATVFRDCEPPHAHVGGRATQIVESWEIRGDRRGVIVNKRLSDQEDRPEKHVVRARLQQDYPEASARKDEENGVRSMGSGWVVVDEHDYDTVDRIHASFTDVQQATKENSEHVPQQAASASFSMFVNNVRNHKILQRRHRSMISWSCGKRDDGTRNKSVKVPQKWTNLSRSSRS